MLADRIVQLVAVVVLVASVTASGVLLPTLVRQSEDHVLRYTNVSVEGAPPWVAIGTGIGALRGLIVDILWIKANAMKEKGLYYEAMADADLITKLQPRYAKVWGFHGHNMAYNISVATHTKEERWEWVNAGIRLVREKGLRYNPNNIELHRELAFWLSHKIEGVADEAHLYYKRMFCHEWHMLLGPPPLETEARIAWIKEIADAPETLQAAEERTPGVMTIIERLERDYAGDGTVSQRLKLDRKFLSDYTLWQEVTQRSIAAKIFGAEQQFRQQHRSFDAFDKVASDPELQDAWRTLIAHVRKRVLIDEYNMDPQLMYEYTRDLGPIDWRHGQAHALYWARRGSQFGQGRLSEEDRYIALNNDAAQLHAMQDLTHFGRITYDPFSTELPGRFPEPRWVDTIDKMFEDLYVKYIDLRGAGGERFIAFLQNYMASACREWYRAGEIERAQKILDRLRELFGQGPVINPEFHKPLDVFVYDRTFDQYQAQPHIAPTDVAMALHHGFRVGILANRPQVLREALIFANKVTEFFKKNEWNDYRNQFGDARIADLVAAIEDSAEAAYLQMITDPAINLNDRRFIWANTDRIEAQIIKELPMLLPRQAPAFRALVYDRAMPVLQRQFAGHELSKAMKFEEAFPPPPGLEEARQVLLQRKAQREEQRQQMKQRDPFLRKGTG